ncbi:tRNA-binding protein [Flexibacter flexilis DSM 6793]|uniref:tRNA-binding protein n=1 Tax=Flexibacter flexilis DSM 6793 TaxID=927664 RepID=A0A1I1DM87_9BACT|nr:tRNA-binding protein [Flexibacter flexilis]SFB73830.1 tRNA-binding protein [Flexibacter flexilis DSM 6793]
MANENTLTWADFEKVEMRVGTILKAEVFEKAKRPAYKLEIDFGQDIGIRKSSAQITQRYTPEDLIGKQIVAVINFPTKQIANFWSECLVLAAVGDNDGTTLLTPDKFVVNGLKIS